MIFFKSCPRCEGDRALEWDSYGWYIICLICGHVTYPADAEVVGFSADRRHGYSQRGLEKRPAPRQAL